MVEDVEAVVDCFVLGDKGCERVYGGEAICPYDNMFVGVVDELFAGISNGCKFSLVNGAEVWKFERVLVYDRVVIVGSDDVSCATAFVGFGSVCVAGYPIVRCFVYDVLELVSVYVWVVSWCCCVEVTLEIECRDSKVSFAVVGDVKVFDEVIVNGDV